MQLLVMTSPRSIVSLAVATALLTIARRLPARGVAATLGAYAMRVVPSAAFSSVGVAFNFSLFNLELALRTRSRTAVIDALAEVRRAAAATPAIGRRVALETWLVRARTLVGDLRRFTSVQPCAAADVISLLEEIVGADTLEGN